MGEPSSIGTRREAVQRCLRLAERANVETVDLKYTSLLGRRHHISLPVERLSASLLEPGGAFDGSSIPGYGGDGSSDRTLLPAPETPFLDPFGERPTLSLVCDITDDRALLRRLGVSRTGR